MNFLNFKKFIFIILIIICPLIFVNIQKNHIEKNALFQLSSSMTHSIRLFFFHYIHFISNTISLYTYLIQVKKNNHSLKNENAQLKIKLMQMKEIQLENQRLNQMLNLTHQTNFHLLPARVIAMDPFPEYHLLTVDKGEKDKIKKNMGALTEAGVIGYIFRVQNNTSQILILSDQNAVLPIRVQRSRVHGLIEGHSQKLLKLKHLRNEDDVLLNDQIVTSGIDKFFPPGLPVGIVSKIHKEEYGLNQEVEVRPSAHLSQIEELFIILKQNHD